MPLRQTLSRTSLWSALTVVGVIACSSKDASTLHFDAGPSQCAISSGSRLLLHYCTAPREGASVCDTSIESPKLTSCSMQGSDDGSGAKLVVTIDTQHGSQLFTGAGKLVVQYTIGGPNHDSYMFDGSPTYTFPNGTSLKLGGLGGTPRGKVTNDGVTLVEFINRDVESLQASPLTKLVGVVGTVNLGAGGAMQSASGNGGSTSQSTAPDDPCGARGLAALNCQGGSGHDATNYAFRIPSNVWASGGKYQDDMGNTWSFDVTTCKAVGVAPGPNGTQQQITNSFVDLKNGTGALGLDCASCPPLACKPVGTFTPSKATNTGDCGPSCPSTCTGNVPEQACYYCQAACLCRCANMTTCATQNQSYAAELGTTSCP